MNANELRIGNKALLTDINEICIITSISNKYIGYETKSRIGECIPSCLNPIPLTEEWLLKFGFEKDDVFNKIFTYLRLHDLCINKLSFRKSEGFICYDGFKYRTLLKHIQYVHQLQNLYFALTGKELVISDAVY
jgi:hypothetical protein